MSTKPSTDNTPGTDPATAVVPDDVRAETAPGADVDATGEDGGDGIAENFGKQAVISIALFIGFLLFVVVCLPIYFF